MNTQGIYSRTRRKPVPSYIPEADSGLVKLVVMTNAFFNNQQHEIKT